MRKTKLTLDVIEKPDFQVAKDMLKPDIIVESGIKEIDKILGGFKTETVTYIDGDSRFISNIPNQLCVNTFRTFNSDTIYIDGGMCADPYKIACYARRMELDQKKTLKHVHISRAFTVYQLSTIIQNMLEQAIRRYKPRTLIIGSFPSFYLDSDVDEKEAQALLRLNLHKIHELTVKYDLITVFTNFEKKLLSSRRNIRGILYNDVDEVVLMKEHDLSTKVRLLNKKKQTVILHLLHGQMRLQDFGMVI